MIETIMISQRTKALIEQLRQIGNNAKLLSWSVDSKKKQLHVKYVEVLAWLHEKNGTKNTAFFRNSRFVRERLRAALLHDLQLELLSSKEKVKQLTPKETSWINQAGFFVLAIAGTFCSICIGFDGITSILSLFTGIPAWIVFVAGFAFAFLSVAVFFGFDLVEISKNLDVDIGQSSQLLDVFIDQVDQIKSLRKRIKIKLDELTSTHKPEIEELRVLRDLTAMLILRYAALDEARDVYQNELNQPYLYVVKFFVAVVAGVLFFGTGFFSAQSLMLKFLSLCDVSATIFAWPVVLCSIVVGVAAFGVYWFVERPGLENLVGRWFGLDQEKILQLADTDIVAKEKKKLQALGQEIDAKLVVHAKTKFEHMHSKTADRVNSTRKSNIEPISIQEVLRPSMFGRPRRYSTGDLLNEASSLEGVFNRKH